MTKPFSLSKFERLKSKKDIDTLFLSGKAFFVFPFKIFYRLTESETIEHPLLFGISVPKKIYKRAVDRNLIKRKAREIYRVNKIELKEYLQQQKKVLHVMFVYTNHDIMTTAEMTPIFKNALKKLRKKVEE